MSKATWREFDRIASEERRKRLIEGEKLPSFDPWSQAFDPTDHMPEIVYGDISVSQKGERDKVHTKTMRQRLKEAWDAGLDTVERAPGRYLRWRKNETRMAKR